MSAERDAGFAAMQQGDIAAAISALERATQSDPGDYQAFLYLGAAYGQAERHTEAVETMTKAVMLQPSNAQARYNLGVTYERAGWSAEALTAMQQAIQLQPNYPQAQAAMQRLQSAANPAPVMPSAAPAVTQGYAQPMQQQSAVPGYAPPAQQPQQPGYAPLTQQMPAYGSVPPAAPPAYQPAPYGQPAPPYGAQPQAPSPYGNPQYPQQMPNPGYGAPNAPYGGQPAPQAFQAPPAQTNVAVGLLVSIGLVLLGGIGAGYFTFVTGIRFPFASIIFGYLFGWLIPKACGHGSVQGIIAGAGAGVATLASIGVAYALGGYVSPISFLLVFYAINRGYRLASGN